MPELPDGVGTGKNSPYGPKGDHSSFSNVTPEPAETGTTKSQPFPQDTHVEIGPALRADD
jgi:hypothetical protein